MSPSLPRSASLAVDLLIEDWLTIYAALTLYAQECVHIAETTEVEACQGKMLVDGSRALDLGEKIAVAMGRSARGMIGLKTLRGVVFLAELRRRLDDVGGAP